MKTFLLLAGAAAMLGATPALAQKGGKGHGPKVHATKHVGHGASAKARAKDQRLSRNFRDRNRNGIDDRRERFIDVNRNGIDDRRERFVDRNGDGIDDRRQGFRMGNKWGGAACPPGLAKKNPPCIPPGQAKRLFRQGQHLSPNYRYYTPYDDIPLALRDRYGLTPDNRYIYRDNSIYVVDPQTRLITSILDAILR